MTKKGSMPLIMAVVTITIVIIIGLSNAFQYSSHEPIKHGVPDFTHISKQINLDELLQEANNQSISIYLPSEVPNDLELTNIYFRANSFLAIVVYSAEGNKDYRIAEFGIQIFHLGKDYTPSFEELQSKHEMNEDESVLLINTWPVLIYEKAQFRDDRYGEYAPLVEAYIEGIQYTLAGPNLSSDDFVFIIKSMVLNN